MGNWGNDELMVTSGMIVHMEMLRKNTKGNKIYRKNSDNDKRIERCIQGHENKNIKKNRQDQTKIKPVMYKALAESDKIIEKY